MITTAMKGFSIVSTRMSRSTCHWKRVMAKKHMDN